MKKVFLQLKKGFTLAEVLITLVIVGVVAALTIPTLVNKYREQALKSQFKKAFSTLSQAVYKTEMNDFYGYAKCFCNGDGCYSLTLSDCENFYDALAKNLQVQKVCMGNSKSEGCVPQYQSYYLSTSSCSGYNEDFVNNRNYSYVLSDGLIINVHGGTSFFPMMLVDINGHKGPNAYGKDLFSLAIIRGDETGLSFGMKGICEFPVEGGRRTNEMILYALAGKK